MVSITPETARKIEAALNRRDSSEVRLKIERGAVVVLAVKVSKIE